MSTLSLDLAQTSRPSPDAPARADDRGAPDRIAEFKLVRSLGSGGMGEVFEGLDTLLDRPVAVKLLRADAEAQMTGTSHLLEARAAARVQHPNVAAVYRVGEIDGRRFIVSELVRGQGLDELPKPVPWRRALELGIGLARGLAAAHRRGVLHGDLKPANAILAEDGTVKLVDFGLARLVDADNPERDPSLILGTPYYMSPEAWVAQDLTRRSDVYSMGALLYELVTGKPPFFGKAPHEVAVFAMRHSIANATFVSPDVDPRFAEIIERCLQRLPDHRYASGEELCEALEALESEGHAAAVPEGNPYRGLLAFEAEHRGVFFGRDSEIGTILERLRTDPFVLVAGDSGTGKSSLCKAGVLPRVVGGDLDRARAGRPHGRTYRAAALVPGRRPAAALAAALSAEIGAGEAEIQRMVLARSPELRALLQAHTKQDKGLLVFVDQLEELLTISDPEEASAVADALGRSLVRAPGVKLLMSIRADFLARATVLPGLGDELVPAIYLLRPLSPDKMRQAIVGPARTKGVTFESDELVDALVASTARAEGGLPLLQFALSELWEAKPASSSVISARSLADIGGVEGALARHADHVLNRLPSAQQSAARRMLCALVTLEQTRARRMAEELTGSDANAKTALDALVRGRLLVASEVEGGTAVEIAHEALVTGWHTLRRFLDEEDAARVVRDRLETAAADYRRLGRVPEALWGASQLAEADRLDPEFLSASEREFLAASRARVKQRKRLRAALLVLVPVVLISMYSVAALKARRDVAARLEGHRREAASALAEAAKKRGEVDDVERRAFEAFDGQRRDDGERLWAEARAGFSVLDADYREASQKLEAALALDAGHAAARAELASVLHARILLAERRHQTALVQELSQRLEVHDTNGAFRALLAAPAKIAIDTDPPGASVSIARYDLTPDGPAKLSPSRALGSSPVEAADLSPGSYVFEIAREGSAPVRYPMLLARGEALSVRIPLLPAARVPEGFVYVPAGRFLFGAADDEMIRRSFLVTVPQHEARTGPFLIARRETTFGDWIEYLRSLSPDERRARMLHVVEGDFSGALRLVERPDGSFELTLKPATDAYSARSGEPIVYRGRATEREQDWSKMPVLGRALDDWNAYLAWLDRTGKVKGARLCTDHEWERAARGADDRLYPHGSVLSPADANYYDTHGKDGANLGPDETSSHPRSASPFGIDDMAGNAFEWVRSSLVPNEHAIRGGCFFFDAVSARSSNRNVVEQGYRDPRFGLRVCASISR